MKHSLEQIAKVVTGYLVGYALGEVVYLLLGLS